MGSAAQWLITPKSKSGQITWPNYFASSTPNVNAVNAPSGPMGQTVTAHDVTLAARAAGMNSGQLSALMTQAGGDPSKAMAALTAMAGKPPGETVPPPTSDQRAESPAPNQLLVNSQSLLHYQGLINGGMSPEEAATQTNAWALSNFGGSPTILPTGTAGMAGGSVANALTGTDALSKKTAAQWWAGLSANGKLPTPYQSQLWAAYQAPPRRGDSSPPT